MKPGDRVNLIKRLASRLSESDRSEAAFILRQFGLPSERYATDDDREWALWNLEDGNDESLMSLFEFLFSGGQGENRPIVTEGQWEPNCFRLFMSHITSDKVLVAAVKKRLLAFGIDSFVAHEDIEPTKEWVSEIEIALDSCHALAAFLTPEFHASKWTDQEVGFCLKRRILIIPIRLGTDPYGFLGRFQGFQALGKDPDAIARGVFDILIKHKLTSFEMATALVAQFEASRSFADARANVQLLDHVKEWTPELLRRIELAVAQNDQVRDAWNVPDKVRSIIRKYGK